jgi:glycosyltransferase involved in cell wall biosynthesis
MRIAHLITRLIQGGADENTLLSCNAQALLGHEVHLIVGAEVSSAMAGRVHPLVRWHQIGALERAIAPLGDLWAACSVTALFRRIRPQIVHTHTSKAGAIGRMAATVARVPGVVHGIHILPFINVGRAERLAYLAAERALAPVTDAFVSVSDGMSSSALAHGIGPAHKHTVVPSGMDLTRFREATPLAVSAVADTFGCAPGVADRLKLVVMVAALESRKRVAEFLDVFARVAAADPQAALVVLGEGPQREALMSRAAARGLGSRVAFPGFRTDVERWIARAHVCVLASEREGLPRAVVQYVLARRPVVSTALPGLDALVRHEVSGFLVPIDRLDLMAEPIGRLLAEPSLAAAMSDAAARIDLTPWSTSSMVSRLEDVYRSVLRRSAES